jgi:hypothetical protein
MGEHVLSISPRTIADVREIVQPNPESDRRFATAAYLSRFNLGLYRSFMQPWVRACVTPWTADFSSKLHPLRITYESWSDRNPFASSVAKAAESVEAARAPVGADNPFWQMQTAMSNAIIASLDFYRDMRDAAVEQTFETFYGQPWLQSFAGLPPQGDSEANAALKEPGDTDEREASIAAEHERLRNDMTEGGLVEASVRALLYVKRTHGEADERRFNLAREMLSRLSDQGILHFKHVVREQAALLRLDTEAAIDALPGLLADAPADNIRTAARDIDKLSTTLPLDDRERADLARVLTIFESASKKKATRRTEAARQQVE